MSEPTRRENVQAGMQRLEALSDKFDDDLIEAAGESAESDRVREQPWLIAGVSDGMGMHTTVAAIDAGLIERGVGVYFEPPALLEYDEGEPVSPVHYARYQNALALEEFADRRGVDFEVLSSDILLAPQRGLKGDIKGDRPEFPEDVEAAVERAREKAPNEDVVFIDSVAFGKWICPREGEEPVEVPSVDNDGRVVTMETKSYHERGYQETLDTMGRNHGRLLDHMKEFGWFGPDALSAFFTWAGGSQNVEVLEGIYGRGSLGDAKIIAERDVVEFRLEHGLDHGEHAIVRLPAFLSSALMAIPGGGLFGLVSRQYLQERGVYRDMPELAARMLRRLTGTEWVRNNPIAQIELDSNEVMHMSEISDRVEEVHDEIEAYREQQTDEERRDPIPLEDSEQLLEGYVPWNYRQLLSRFRPNEDQEGREFHVDQSAPMFEEHLVAPVAESLTAALAAAEPDIAEAASQVRPRWIQDDFEWVADDVDPAIDALPEQMHGMVVAELADDAETLELRRAVYAHGGRQIGEGKTTIGFDGTVEFEKLDWLGEPAGAKFEIEGNAARSLLTGRPAGRSELFEAAALAGFAEASLLGSGRTDRVASELSWQMPLDRRPGNGTKLVTYARRDDETLFGRVVDGRGESKLALSYSE